MFCDYLVHFWVLMGLYHQATMIGCYLVYLVVALDLVLVYLDFLVDPIGFCPLELVVNVVLSDAYTP